MCENWNHTLPTKKDLVPGEQLCLSLSGIPGDASVRWECAFMFPKESDHGRTVVFDVPQHADVAFGSIKCTVSTSDGKNDSHTISCRVKPVSVKRPVKPSETATPHNRTDPPDLLEPEVVEPADSIKNPAPQTYQGQPIAADPNVTSPTPAAPLGESAVPSPTPPADPPVSLPAGDYYIQVLRRDQPIPELKTAVPVNKTIRIGKRSATYGVPELDLKGRFETPDMEKMCSRSQADVFWKNGAITVVKTGYHDIKRLQTNGDLETMPSPHYWQPDEVIALPGRLRLKLKREEPC
ncbi:hypothetical protein [Desulfobacter latus]|uniref:Uncharacterized protein n=1 Tax=Desulfobacter latus TaxID=2292 RepID=A0A850SWU5_9BACT|nr:hypothetical protein [Desulfobacter latus]NWH03883.1 hypothetical protein [Desulfobacter latus]